MNPIALMDEKELLLHLKEGHERAFNQLYQLYSPRIFGNILKLVHNRSLAEDILQEIFLKVWDRREEIDLDKSFVAYLFTCSRNQAYDALRREKLEVQLNRYLSDYQPEGYQHVEEQVFFKEAERQLQQAVDKLPPKRKEVYQLCKTEGLSYEQAASTLGLSTSTIHDHMVKANHFIREQLLKDHPELLLAIFMPLMIN